MRHATNGIAALALLVALGCDGRPEVTPGAAAAAEGDVRATVDAIIAADNAGDLDAVMALYTDDAVLLPPGGQPITGRAAIREHYTGIFRAGDLELAARSAETRVFGDWAMDRGVTMGRALPAQGEPVEIDDTYLMLLRREPEGWRIARLIWNANP